MARESSPAGEVVLLGVGDLHPSPDEPPEPLFEYTAPVLREADITFGQLEVLFSDEGSLQLFPSAAAFIHVPPDFAACLPYAGFDVVSCASNHSVDWGLEAMLDNVANVRREGVHTIGAGSDLADARTPAVIERNGTRVAMLGYTSVAPPGGYATPSRAGVAPLRVKTWYEALEYQPGTPARTVTVAEPDDVAAIQADVEAAKADADVVVVSFHWGVHHLPKVIADYQPAVAHAVVDAGADLVLGHHAHILKAVEVYKGKTIFYSLGNFAMSGTHHSQKADPVRDSKIWYYHRLRSQFDENATVTPVAGQPAPLYPKNSEKSLIAKAVIRNGSIERVSFLPAWINDKSQPELPPPDDPRFAEVVRYMDWTSEEFPHHFRVDGDEVVVEAPAGS